MLLRIQTAFNVPLPLPSSSIHSSLSTGDNNRKEKYYLPQCTAVRLFINQSKFVECVENEMLPISFRYIFTDLFSSSSLCGITVTLEYVFGAYLDSVPGFLPAVSLLLTRCKICCFEKYV